MNKRKTKAKKGGWFNYLRYNSIEYEIDLENHPSLDEHKNTDVIFQQDKLLKGWKSSFGKNSSEIKLPIFPLIRNIRTIYPNKPFALV